MAQRKEDFWSRYNKLCLKNKIYPSRSIMKGFKDTDLSCIVEGNRSEHWKCILLALCKDNSLTKVHFASCISPHEDEDVENVETKRNKRKKCFPTPYGRTARNISHIALALDGLLQCSQTLIILKLENLSFKLSDAQQLSNGLAKSCYLKYLSLSGCHFEEGAIPAICRGLNISCVSWIDFSSCALTLADIEAISIVIKAHNIRRSNQMFQKTLRYQVPNLQDLPGINRLSLNFNSIEDDALDSLIESMSDDIWIKALDLQNCDIDGDGADLLLHLACANASIVLIDLRLNPIDETFLNRIAQQLSLNRAGKDVKYTELPLWKSSELVRKYNAIGKVKTIKKMPVHKFKIVKKSTKSFNYYVKSPQTASDKSISMKDASVQTPEYMEIQELLLMVKSLRTRLQNEIKMKKFFTAKYHQIKVENDQLREMLRSQNDDIYIDQETYFDIKHTFEKLKVFFDVMKKYGLWEYISMLGFDESTDVILEESNSQKCIKVTRDEAYFDLENAAESDREVCCNCRKLDFKHTNTELPLEPVEAAQNCIAASSAKASTRKIAINDDPVTVGLTHRLIQEVVNDYSNASSHQVHNTKSTPGRMPDLTCTSQDNIKPSSSKQSRSSSPKAVAGAHMLIKKFSYSNMPKQLKELVSPADFYNIVKKELERCENEARKPFSSQVENEISNSAQASSTHVKQSSHKLPKCKNEVNAIPTGTIIERRPSSSKLSSKASNDVDENMTISELIARERVTRQAFTKKDSAKSSISPLSSSKNHKNANHAKIKETKSLIKCEQILPKSKLKLSSSQSNSKKTMSRSNVSSDEINSSDSVVTASDKLSTHSSASSLSSNKSHGKSPSDYTDNEPEVMKSYIESVSDASTFKDVESLSDIELPPQVYSSSASVKEDTSKHEMKVESVSSQSSTLKSSPESKNSKPSESAVSGSSSKKGDKSPKTNTHSQGKTKNANKHNSKNRPKSNSSKSSSVPPLSDITTVSSHSLNTDSVMKQLSGSDDKSKGKK